MYRIFHYKIYHRGREKQRATGIDLTPYFIIEGTQSARRPAHCRKSSLGWWKDVPGDEKNCYGHQPTHNIQVRWITPKALNDLNPTIIITLNLSFSEFLPRVLGPEYVKIFGLSLRKDGYSNVYNNRCSPDIYNSFATAAFRFGHSLIKPMFSLVPSKRQAQPDEIRLRHHFNNPDIVFRWEIYSSLVVPKDCRLI